MDKFSSKGVAIKFAWLPTEVNTWRDYNKVTVWLQEFYERVESDCDNSMKGGDDIGQRWVLHANCFARSKI